MKIHTFLLSLVIMLSLQTCNQSENSQDLDDVTKLLTQLSTDWSEAIRNGDASEVVDLFAADFMYQSENGEIIYRDEFIKNINENINPIESYELKDIKVHLYEKDLANVTGAFNTKWIDQDGEEQISKTRFTDVWKKNSGKWQCIIGYSNPLFGTYHNREKGKQNMKADKQTEAAVVAVFHKFYEAYTADDLNTAMGTLVQDPDVVFLGAGQDERRVGPSEARAQMQRDLSQVEGISFKDEWHHVSASGDVAWMVTDGTLSWTAGGTQESAPSRISVVFVKRNDRWLMAQFHFSFIDLRQADGQSFPSQL